MKTRKTHYNKITASLNNSAAIDKNGEVFVWGLAKTGILGDNTSTNQYSPQSMNIKGMDSQFKAIHVTMGLNHIAVLVNYAILDLIDFNSSPPQSIKEIIEAHKIVMNVEGINVLKQFEKQLYQQRYINRSTMVKFFETKKFPLDEKDPKAQNQVSFSVSQVEEFFDFFCLKDPQQFNLVEYYYQTNKSKIKRSKLLVWGMSDTGRLGLSRNTLDFAQSKSRKRGKNNLNNKDSSESEEDYDDEADGDEGEENEEKEFNKNNHTLNQSFTRTYVNKQVNDEFKDDIKHVACGHHHTLVVTEKGTIYYFGMGTQGQLGNENFVNVYEPTKLRIHPKRKFIQVACGSSHSMALTDEGKIFSWGKNTRGQLGHGHRNDQLKPALIQADVLATCISCGDQHSAFISDNKELYTWGNGQYFRLGHGVSTDELVPKNVVVLEDVYVTHVSCGMTHTLAITNEGFVYAWGDGMSGKLGVSENNKSINLPTRVGMNDTKFRKKVYYQVSAGGLHSLALTDQGILYSWGSSKAGVLGIGFQKDNKEYYSIPQKIRSVGKIQSKNPKQIQFFSIKKFIREQKMIDEQKVRDIQKEDNNNSFQVANQNDMSLSCLQGSNLGEQNDVEIPFTSQIAIFRMIFRYLALEDAVEKEEKMIHKRIIFVVASANNSFFISDIGQVHACGSPKKGILIMDPKNEKLIIKKKKQVAAQIPYNNNQQGTMLTQNENSSVAQSKSNFKSSVKQSIGRSTSTNQAQGKTQNKKKAQPDQNLNLIFDYPILIPYFKNKIIYMSCSYTHAIAISHKGVAYSWGCNKYYQLGLGYHCSYNYIPSKIQGALETKRIIMSTCSDRFSALLTEKGEVWTFGTSDSGVLGHEQKNYYVVSEPKMINDIPLMIYLTSGPQGMMAITSEKRQIYAWGNNLYGQLGIQITNNNMNVDQFGQNLDDSGNSNNIEKDINLEDQNKKITKNQIIYLPTRVKIENDRKIQISNIGMGMFHSVAIDDQGHLYSCGLKKFSGLAESLSKEGLSGFDDTLTYIQHDKIRNYKFQQVSVSEYHTLALTDGEQMGVPNRVFGWGLCNLGNLCLEDQKDILDAIKQMKYQMKDIDLNEPLSDMFVLPIDLTEIGKFDMKPDDPNDLHPNFENIIYISAGLMHNLAINENGKCFSWGSIQNGRLGINVNHQNLPSDQFFTTTPSIVSVLFDESKDDQEMETFNGSNIDPSQRKSMKSKKNSVNSKMDTLSKQKSQFKSSIGGFNSVQQQSQQQQQQQEEDGQNEEILEIDDQELDILEQTSFGSDSSKDVFSTDNEQDQQMQGQKNEQKKLQNSLDQDFSNNEDDDYSVYTEQQQQIGNIFSKLPQTHKRQDNVQKKILKEEDCCMEQNLLKEDKELEDLAKTIIDKCLKLVYENEKNLQQAESKIESIIQTQIKNHSKKKGLEILDKIYFSVPSFIVKNIQLYETIFSLLYHHPCYILNLLKTNSLSIFHLKALINQLFKNPIDFGPSNFTLITLTIETFKYEYSQGSIHINDIKNIQQSSLFWHLYTILFERQRTTVEYFKKLVTFTIGKDICHQIYVTARMKLQNDNPKYLSNLLDYLQGTTSEIVFKADLLLKTIQPLMTKIAGDFQSYTAANQQIFTEELLYVHSKIVHFAKKFTLRKLESAMREERRQQQIEQNTMDNSFEDPQFEERQIQKKLQYKELSLDNKLNNFIFLISYGYIIYIIENFERFEIQIDSSYLPILKSANNIKIIAELLERFITKQYPKNKSLIPNLQQQQASININNNCFNELNKFLLERKEGKKKNSDQFYNPKRQQPINPGTKPVLPDLSIDESQEANKDQRNDISQYQEGGGDYEETQDESYQEEQNLDALIDRIQKSLHLETDFELSVSQIQSLVEQSSNLKTHYLQVSLATLFQIHNIYTQNHSNSDLFVITQDKLDKKGIKKKLLEFDPIYVIFSYLQFEPINVEDFQTEILERKVNLKLSDDLTYFSFSIRNKADFYKCIDCGAIIPIQYLPSHQQMNIAIIKKQNNQWKCTKGHMNSLKNYKCTEFSCDDFISDTAIKNFRLIKYYDVNKVYGVKFYAKKEKKQNNPNDLDTMKDFVEPEELNKKQILNLIYKILKECDPLKEGENEYEFFDIFKKKPKLKENPELKNNVNQLIETLEIGFRPPSTQNSYNQGSYNQENNQDQMNNSLNMSLDHGEDELEKKQIYWNDKFKYYKDLLGIVIRNYLFFVQPFDFPI